MNQWEEFCLWSDARYAWLRTTGEDVAVGTEWSTPLNSNEFLDGLQKMRDPLAECNLIFWAFLHYGSELPN